MNLFTTTRREPGALAVGLVFATLVGAAMGTGRTHAQAETGATIIFEECSVVTLEVVQSYATYTSIFWRFGPGPDADLGFSSQQVGQTSTIGEVPENTELILGIFVQQTGNVFKTGPADRNPDNRVHAISDVAGPGTVGFEDKAANETNADFDYNDAILLITTEPCTPPPPQQATLTLNVDPASDGVGSVQGAGVFDIGVTTVAQAVPGAASSFVSWSGSCAGGSPAVNVLMDADKVCSAFFSAVAGATPTPTATPLPPIAGPPPGIDIANTRTSPSPADVGGAVVFRIDVSLTDVPVTNEAEVLVTFDDSHLEYTGSLTSACTLFSIGVVCDFGAVTTDFSFDLDFTALEVTTSTATNATLGADFDAAGPGAAVVAGPASANVAIVDVAGIQLPPLGDGSAGAGTSDRTSLTFALGIAVLGTAMGAGIGMTRRRAIRP